MDFGKMCDTYTEVSVSNITQAILVYYLKQAHLHTMASKFNILQALKKLKLISDILV